MSALRVTDKLEASSVYMGSGMSAGMIEGRFSSGMRKRSVIRGLYRKVGWLGIGDMDGTLYRKAYYVIESTHRGARRKSLSDRAFRFKRYLKHAYNLPSSISNSSN